MVPLVIATRNAHKVAEIRAILGDRFRYLTLNDLPAAPRTIEDAQTFAGNAAKKARELARWVAASRDTNPMFVLADDSGLEVDALNGLPGVNSARFAALDTGKPGNSSDADNNAKLLRLLTDMPPENRTARFRCVLALTALHPPSSILHPQLFEGVCEGRIGYTPRGQGGFGYDPLFIPNGFEQTFAELGEAVKNRLSHRAKALAALGASQFLSKGC
jgi:XTP/dITP diphosphohydrolase